MKAVSMWLLNEYIKSEMASTTLELTQDFVIETFTSRHIQKYMILNFVISMTAMRDQQSLCDIGVHRFCKSQTSEHWIHPIRVVECSS